MKDDAVAVQAPAEIWAARCVIWAQQLLLGASGYSGIASCHLDFFQGGHSQCGCHHTATDALSLGVALSQGLRMLGSETHPKSKHCPLTWVFWHHSSNSSSLRHWTPAVLQEGLNTHLYGIRDATPTSSNLRSCLWSFGNSALSGLFSKQLF